ncbi:MAG TPA: glycerophosphodiester phosphodiesterase [Alphaproteobacteria bacterium]
MTSRAVLVFLGCLATVAAAGFDLEGHRGARGLMPENTLPAFAKALSLGVDTLELDTGITKDGVVVISHNRVLEPAITRGPDGAWLTAPGPAIHALTLAELRRYDVGAIRPGTDYYRQFPGRPAVAETRVPTLAELAALLRRSGNAAVRLNVETKLSPLAPQDTLDPEAFAAALVAALRQTGLAGRAMVQSFDWRTLKVVQRIAPEIPTVCLTLERGPDDNIRRGQPGPSPWTAGLDVDDHAGSVPRLVKAAGCAVWSPFFRDLTDDALTEAKALGLKTVVWTVNEPADMSALIQRGVDGIISDYPDRLRGVLADRGMPLPAATPVEP